MEKHFLENSPHNKDPVVAAVPSTQAINSESLNGISPNNRKSDKFPSLPSDEDSDVEFDLQE